MRYSTHNLKSGDKLVDTDTEEKITVTKVRPNGSVEVRLWHDDYGEKGYTESEWSEKEVTAGLKAGILEVVDSE